MTAPKPTRLIGRIDKVFESAQGVQWGFLVTGQWKVYCWHTVAVRRGERLAERNVVAFTPVAPLKAGQKPRAVNIELLSREDDAEEFARKYAETGGSNA